MPHLDQAAEKFDGWVKEKENEKYFRFLGIYDKHNTLLVEFLNGNEGFLFVKTYEELCQLAKLLQKKGYHTTNPPCKPSEFVDAIEKAEEISSAYYEPIYGDLKPIFPTHAMKLQKQNESNAIKTMICMINSYDFRISPNRIPISLDIIILILQTNSFYDPETSKKIITQIKFILAERNNLSKEERNKGLWLQFKDSKKNHFKLSEVKTPLGTLVLNKNVIPSEDTYNEPVKTLENPIPKP